jgi:hypothetical protein
MMYGGESDHTDSSADQQQDFYDSEIDDEYGILDSPASRFPSPLLIGGKKEFKDKNKVHRLYPDNDSSTKSSKSNLTSISDMLLNSAAAAAAAASSDLTCGQGAAINNQAQELLTALSSKQRSRTLQTLIFALVLCGGYLCYESMHRKQPRMGELHGEDGSHQPMHSHHIRSGSSISPQTIATYDHERQSVYQQALYEDKIATLASHVQSLRMTLQQVAEQQLTEIFFDGIVASPSYPYADVELPLEGLNHPLVIQVARSEMPYTTWVFLREMKNSKWILRSEDQWMEIVMVSKGDRQGAADVPSYENFDFLEDSIDADRSFVVGMRNAKEGDIGPVISIYNERGMCGHYEHEVCFGKVVDGFDSLNSVTEMQYPVGIGPVTIISK